MNEIMLKAKFNDCFLSLNPENQFSRPLSALPRQNHPVREEPGDGESIGLSSLHHAMESHARETFDLGEPPGMIVAVEPGDDVTMPAQGREDLGRIPGIVPSRGRHGMIRADDDLESALRGVSRDAFEPGELLRPDSSVPILRLRQPASLRAREFGGGLTSRLAAGERRVRAHGAGVEDEEAEAGPVEITVARGDPETGVDLRFLPVQQGEIVIAEDVLPAVARGSRRSCATRGRWCRRGSRRNRAGGR